MSRYWGHYVKSEPIATTLDLIRVIVENGPLKRAHITLAGPHDNMSDLSQRTRSFSSRQVILKNVIQLKFGSRYIAALTVSAVSISKSMDKKGIEKPIPHLTLFESDDPEYFSRFFRAISRRPLRKRVELSSLQRITGKFWIEESLYQIFQLDEVFRMATGLNFDPRKTGTLSVEERVLIVDRLWEFARRGEIKHTASEQ